MKSYFIYFLKGAGMGAANVIPGVSGGTIALITGIFERIIHSIKRIFSIHSFQLLIKRQVKEWLNYSDFFFLFALGIGMLVAIVSIAHLFEYLFAEYPTYIWAFFFGLVLASVYFVGRTVSKWNLASILFFVFGTVIAASFALLTPASENADFLYLFVCGIVAACSMILPGISGSFVLVLMGNYELVMIHAVNEMNFKILLPVVLGAGFGLLGFSYILSWVFRQFRNQTIALLTGFMLGSLLIIWPWKDVIYKANNFGEHILDRHGKEIVEKYNYLLPESFSKETIIAILMIITGFLVITVMEVMAERMSKRSIK